MRRALLLATSLAAAPSIAHAQASAEDRLRDALRKTTVDLRASQDAQASLQSQVDQAAAQRAALQKQIDALNAKVAAQPAAPAPQAAPPPPPAPDRSQAEVRALQGQVQSLQASLAKYQASYNEAAGVARSKDAESRQAAQAAKAGGEAIKACDEENAKLLETADDILHLYSTAGFRTAIIGSYEPLLGLKKVELQNIVQDYEDKLRDLQRLPETAAESGPPVTGR